MNRSRLLSHAQSLALSAVLLAFVAGPTPGDIGGCGQEAQLLDARTFFASKADLDCRRCQECSLYSSYCSTACDRSAALPEAFPAGCYPLVHDGEVCLHALHNASCKDYAGFVRDVESQRDTPTECNFCPSRE